jgi:hypothetical protein
MTQSCSQTHIERLLGLVLQPDSLKLESFKFNVIINITFESDVAVKSKIFGYSFAKKPNTFRF